MRPAHVFAKPASDDAESEIVALLQGPWRFALRLVMIWLSVRGLSAAEIAVLFEYDPLTVRRWINRYNDEGVAGLEDRRCASGLGSALLGPRIRMLLRQPGAWTVKAGDAPWRIRRYPWRPWPGEPGRPAVTVRPRARLPAVRRPVPSPSQPGRAGLGRHEAAPGQLADADHAGTHPGSPRVLPLPNASPDAGHRVPLQHALATAGLWTEVVEGCLVNNSSHSNCGLTVGERAATVAMRSCGHGRTSLTARGSDPYIGSGGGIRLGG